MTKKSKSLRGDKLDAEIIDKVSKVIFSEENVKKFYSFVESVKSDEKTELQVRLEQNERGMKELEKKLNNYRKSIELGVDISLVVEPMNALKSEKQSLEEINRELRARLENQPSPEAFKFTKKAYDNFKEMADAFFSEASVDNLRVFLQRFIQKILVYPDKISIVYIPPVSDTFNDSGPDDPFTVSMVPKGGFEPPRGSPTTPSRWRVYQFHHFGINLIFAIVTITSSAPVREFEVELGSERVLLGPIGPASL